MFVFSNRKHFYMSHENFMSSSERNEFLNKNTFQAYFYTAQKLLHKLNICSDSLKANKMWPQKNAFIAFVFPKREIIFVTG